jgi:DNA-binding transcriptional ArsR family regulator
VTPDLDLNLLAALAPPGHLFPDFLYQPAPSARTTLAEQLEQLERGGIGPVAADITEVWGERPLPACMASVLDRGDDGLRVLTGTLEAFWRRSIAPHWPSIRAVAEGDVAHRSRQVVDGGIHELFVDIHPEASVDGGLLRIHKPHLPDVTYPSTSLTLVPSVFVFPYLVLSHDDSGQVVLIYGARGSGRVWEGQGETDTGSDADHLAALLGRTRSAILTRLGVPMTTSQLAAEFGQSGGTVSEHLTCLRSAGLLISWRNGRRVYYRQTQLAASLIDACESGQADAAG